MRWLCVHLPQLALELRDLQGPAAAPAVILDPRGNRLRVWRANAAARAHGIRSGLSLGSAQALCASLHSHPRQPDAERQAQQAVATLACQFSSEVCLSAEGAVLLEIERSLQLFGSPERLAGKLVAAIRRLGHQAHLQFGWGATAALLLSALPGRWRDPAANTATALQAALLAAPLSCLRRDSRCPPVWREHLQQLGLHTLGDLLALPPASLGRRFGSSFLDFRERLLGQRPDPLPAFRLPEQFDSRLELPAEISDAERLLFPAQRLLRELENYLRARQLACTQLHWQLRHADGRDSHFRLGAARASWRHEDWRELLRLRLEREHWHEPVRELRLQVSSFQPLAAAPTQLFADAGKQQADEARLCNLLRARLGEQALQVMRCVDSPWPEQAGLLLTAPASPGAAPGERPPPARNGSEPGGGMTSPGLAERPLLLLDTPLALISRAGRPYYRGELTLEPGIERLAPDWLPAENTAEALSPSATTRPNNETSASPLAPRPSKDSTAHRPPHADKKTPVLAPFDKLKANGGRLSERHESDASSPASFPVSAGDRPEQNPSGAEPSRPRTAFTQHSGEPSQHSREPDQHPREPDRHWREPNQHWRELHLHWRDYVIARNAQGERFWLFRDPRQPEQWYLHGLFGS